MAWDCRIGFRLNLFNVLILKVLLIQILLLGFLSHNKLCVQAIDICDGVHHCSCFRSEAGKYEIECPNKILTTYPITGKVSASGNEASLELACAQEKLDFGWRLMRGVNFSTVEQDFVVTALLITGCPIPPESDGMEHLLSHLGIDSWRIKYFKFVSHRDLHSFPDYMLSPLANLTVLSLSQNGISLMPNVSLLPNLKRFDINTNDITELPADAFASNKLLQRFELRNNNLTEIIDGSLPESLDYIDLSSNRISKITNNTFSNLMNLTALVLDRNPLENVDPHAFSSLSQLKHLRLNEIPLRSFPVLGNLTSLTEVSISHNLHYLAKVEPTVLPEPVYANVTLEPLPSSGDPEINASYRTDNNDSIKIPEINYPGNITDLPSLTHLSLMNDGLTTVPNLNNVPKLTVLDLKTNRIQSVPTSVFANVPGLKRLVLSGNIINHVGSIQAKNLTDLDLSSNRIDRLAQSMFEHLANLEKLNLARNQITHIHPKAFEALRKLKTLDLSRNKINLAQPDIIPGFDAGALSGHSPLRFLLELETINLSHNKMNSIPGEFYQSSLKLKTLDLSYNELTEIHVGDINFIQNSIDVNLSNNRIKVIDMSYYDVYLTQSGEEEQIRIQLGGNPLNCDCLLLHFKLYNWKQIKFIKDNLYCAGPDEPRNLTGVTFDSLEPDDLVCTFPSHLGCPEDCDCWRRPSDYTIIVDCSGSFINNEELPTLQINGTSKDYVNAKRYDFILDLSSNGIKRIPDGYAAKLSNRVKTVDLRRNSLQSLSFLKSLGENNVTRFNLSDNPFPCYDCAFHTDSRSQFSRLWDSDNLTCLVKTSSGYQTRKPLEFDYESICSDHTIDVVVPIVVLLMFIIIATIIYLRNGWAVRAYIYSKGYGFLLCDSYPEDDEEKLYDAFVSYSSRDEALVEELVNRLEEQEGFKLCLHFRDWTPGDWIPDQIVRSVDQSRRTVVVLSKNFVESVWSRLEFKAAHSQALTERSNRLILVLMGDDLTDSDIKDEDLKVYMKMNTYIKWNDPWFWHKLKYALPHRKCLVEENRNHYMKRVQRERAIQLDKIRSDMENQVVS